MSYPQTQSTPTQQQEFKTRYGCIAARIGATLKHQIGVELPVQAPERATSTTLSAGPARAQQFVMQVDERQKSTTGSPVMVPKAVKAGASVMLGVQDVTRWPDEAKVAHWLCQHTECKGQKWDSKKSLLQDHPANKDLASVQQTHVYYAVFEQPAVAAKKNDKGVVVQEATEAFVLLLSDEE
jgi:hypothetical protein